MVDFSLLFKHCSQILSSFSGKDTKRVLTDICVYLQKEVDYYDWVGFYFAQVETKTLHLEAYAGEATEHKVIPFGKGICGQVAVSNQSFLVEDVLKEDNYIACNIEVKSELVVPLFNRDQNIGQIDIDSKKPEAFSKKDIDFLEQLNRLISDTLF